MLLITEVDVSIGSLRLLDRELRPIWVNLSSIGGLRKVVVTRLARRTQTVLKSISPTVDTVIAVLVTKDFSATHSQRPVVAVD